MKKIILALIIVASLYALNVWAQTPVSESEISAINTDVQQDNASFTLGSFLILFSIAAGYLAKKIYAFRSINEE